MGFVGVGIGTVAVDADVPVGSGRLVGARVRGGSTTTWVGAVALGIAVAEGKTLGVELGSSAIWVTPGWDAPGTKGIIPPPGTKPAAKVA